MDHSWKTVSLEFSKDDRIATITIDRPDRLNALDVTTLEALDDAIAQSSNAHVVVLTGAGDTAFVAGADIEYMSEMTTPEALTFAQRGHAVCNAIETHSAPVIAAVNGYAFGGGCELALAADLRVASENAVLGQTEIDLGIVPGWGGTQRLVRLVGDERARRMIYFGDRLDSEEALEASLVSEVVPQSDLSTHVQSMAEELAQKPSFALSTAKAAINQVHELHQHAGLEYEQRVWSGLFGTHDQREGMAAFLADRDPTFE